MKHSNLLFLAALLTLFISCSDDDDPVITPEPIGAYANGILIANEGPFASGYGSVSYISNDYNTVEQNIYQNVNTGDNVGNVLNSIGFFEDEAYLIANVSNKIAVVDRYTFEKKGLITSGLVNPRHFAGVDGIGYVTNWGDPFDNEDDYVAVIDLTSESIISNIPVDFGPEKMVVVGTRVYVAHKGGYGHNNVITVIDTLTNSIVEEIQVGDVPGSMIVDNRGKLWVLCEGIPSWTGAETNGSLMRINLGTNQIELELDFATNEHPQFLSGDTGNMYYSLDGNIYTMRDTASELPTSESISGVYFYSMEVRDGILYGADAKDYASNGSIEIYDMLGGNSFVQSIPSGIIPGGIYFN